MLKEALSSLSLSLSFSLSLYIYIYLSLSLSLARCAVSLSLSLSLSYYTNAIISSNNSHNTLNIWIIRAGWRKLSQALLSSPALFVSLFFLPARYIYSNKKCSFEIDSRNHSIIIFKSMLLKGAVSFSKLKWLRLK